MLAFLLKYKELLEILSHIIFIIFTFIISYKGLDTINKYQNKKEMDLKYQNKFDLIKQSNKQLHELNLVISKTHVLFRKFNNEYLDFESKFFKLDYDSDFNIKKEDSLKIVFNQLKNKHLQLNEKIFESYLLDLELIDNGTMYAFSLSEYLYTYSKIFEHMNNYNDLPYKIKIKNEYFEEHTIIKDKLTDSIFDLFSKVTKKIRETRANH